MKVMKRRLNYSNVYLDFGSRCLVPVSICAKFLQISDFSKVDIICFLIRISFILKAQCVTFTGIYWHEVYWHKVNKYITVCVFLHVLIINIYIYT